VDRLRFEGMISERNEFRSTVERNSFRSHSVKK